MRYSVRYLPLGALLVLFIVPAILSGSAASRLSSDELLVKYLDALGTSEMRAAAKSRVAEGTVEFNELMSGNVHLDGRAALRSEGPKLKCIFQLPSPQYPGEQLAFDGKNAMVARIDQQSRSMLGDFLVNEPEILKEGLWGGELSTAWPLLDVKGSGIRLRSEGLRKLAGQELYVLLYTQKKRNEEGELEIRIGFEPGTFRHVLTEYRLTAAPFDAENASGTATVVTTVDEQFGDFHTVSGLTLPARWEIEIHREPDQSRGFAWHVVFTSITNNQ